MQIPFIPEIEGYADMVDLLANVPQLQQRLKDLKVLEDQVNKLIGSYADVQDIKQAKIQAAMTADEAKQLLIDSRIQSAALVGKAQEQHDRLMAVIEKEQEDRQMRMTELTKLEARLSQWEQQLNQIAASQKETDKHHVTADTALREREKRLGEIVADFAERKRKIIEIME